MRNFKKRICILFISTIALSSICVFSSSCASSGSSMGEPTGLYKYSQKRSNVVRSNVKVKDSSPSKYRSKNKKY
jgi:hypothetical protein